MILIADSGSTKTEWCVTEPEGIIRQFSTAGTNPYLQTTEEIMEEWELSLFPKLKKYKIEAVYFYGAGCAFPEKRQIISDILASQLETEVEVYSDLMGAARALCGRFPGIACILGTGSNSCFYDGVEIVEHTPPLGFILGDEGGGAYLGKRLVSDCLKHQLPKPLIQKFMDSYGLTQEAILERVYKVPFANRYLATLSQFLLDNIKEPAIHKLVFNSFTEFLERNVKQYNGSDKFPIHYMGSVAYFYQGILREATMTVGLHPGVIIQTPMEGLISYHTD